MRDKSKLEKEEKRVNQLKTVPAATSVLKTARE